MMTILRFSSCINLALVILGAVFPNLNNVSAFVGSKGGARAATFVVRSSSSSSSSSSQPSIPEPEIAHLQKKLKYWKGEQIKKQEEYKRYVCTANIASKAKPIYTRVGKIDMYKSRPVFDQESTRIQTEVWSIKEKIKLTQAKLDEERRIQRVTEQMAQRLSQQDAEIRSVREQEKQEQEKIRKEAEEKVLALQAQSTQKLMEKEQQIEVLAKDIQSLNNTSTQKLMEKEQEIAALAMDIQSLSNTLQEKQSQLQTKECDLQSLSNTLQEKRSQLRNKESDLLSLQTELKTKESILHNLNRERASIRSLARQSWRLLKTRVQKRLPHRENNKEEDNTGKDNGNATEGIKVSETEKVPVQVR